MRAAPQIFFAASLSSSRLRVNPFNPDIARSLPECLVGSREAAKKKEGAKE
jgi:hypothetical protein